MNRPTEKEQLLSMLTEIYNQLEELDLVLEASFSDTRKSLEKDLLDRLIIPKQRMEEIDKELDNISSLTISTLDKSRQYLSGPLKLELGF